MNYPAFPFSRLLVLSTFLAIAVLSEPLAVRAQSIVEVCSQEELEARIAEARSSDDGGDGTILINCDGILSLTNTITLSFDTDTNDPINEITLDGTGFGVSISGISESNPTNRVRLFLVDSGVTLTLINIKLIDGQGAEGGAIHVRSNGTLIATSCVFSNNLAFGTNGIDGNSASTSSDSDIRGRSGSSGGAGFNGWGGAVFNLGIAEFEQCAFLTNSAIGGNGGIGGSGSGGISVGGDGGIGGSAGSGLGGAIYSAGTLRVTECSFHLNNAVGGIGGDGGFGGEGAFPGLNGRGKAGGAASGAAIFSDKFNTAIIAGSTFALNTSFGGDSASAGTRGVRGKSGSSGAIASGGAVANYGTNLLVNCTFFGNLAIGGIGGDGAPGTSVGGKGGTGGAAWGGNIFNGGKRKQRGIMQAINCTFSDGGAIGGTNGLGGPAPFPGKDGRLGRSRGANIANSNGLFQIQNVLVAYPNPGTDAYGKFIDDGHNILSDRSYKFKRSSTSTNFLANPTDNQLKLGLLARNGGRVETVELMEESAAIDAGDDDITLNEAFEDEDIDLSVDARGVDRALPIDIGAYESGLVLGPPRFIQHPISRTVREGDSVTFTAIVKGDAPLIFQWQTGSIDDPEDLDDLDGETSQTETNGQTIVSFTIEFVSDFDERDYFVTAFNNSGSATSDAASLTLVSPPFITSFPGNFINSSGVDFTLTVDADGDAPFTYEWYRNGLLIPGATLSTLIVGNPQSTADYTVVVENAYGEDSSSVRVTILPTSPTIDEQPADQVSAVGGIASFVVDASGSQPLSYQWFFNDTNLLTGKTSHLLTIGSLQVSNAGTYLVVVSNAVGTATSRSATLIVQTTPPSITTQPADAGVPTAGSASFSVGVTGSAPFGYQWFLHPTTTFSSVAPISGGTNATLEVMNVQSNSTGYYSAVVTNFVGSVTSAPAALTIFVSPPIIQTNPASASIFSGETNTFSVSAIGSTPLMYQWYFNSNSLPDATNATFTITNAQASDAGFYHVVITNVLGSATSAPPAELTVTDSAPIITVPPVDVFTAFGGTATLSVTAVGSQPLSYQWFYTSSANGGAAGTVPVTDGTNSTLIFLLIDSGTAPSIDGAYRVDISNGFGTTSSSDVNLDVDGI